MRTVLDLAMAGIPESSGGRIARRPSKSSFRADLRCLPTGRDAWPMARWGVPRRPPPPVKIVDLKTIRVEVPLAKPIRTAVHDIRSVAALLLAVDGGDGRVGEGYLFAPGAR